MAEDGQLGGFARGAEPTVADLLDPIALEARLKEARARRADALARREAGQPLDTGASGRRPPPLAPIPLAPKPPAWLDELAAAPAPDPVPLAEPGPAARLRPVLLTPSPSAVRPPAAAPGEPPTLLAPALPGTELEDRILAATRSPAPARRRFPPAALLFVAGLGLGAAAVAMAVRPAPEPPATVASIAAPAPSDDAPALASLPAAPDPAASAPHPAVAADIAPPAGLAAPASEPAPPPMTPPDPTIGSLIASATAPATEAAAPATPGSATPEGATLEAGALPQRVSIHYPRSAQALAGSVQATLRAAGIADVEIMPVGFAIGRSNVRFYHASDRTAAEGASALLAGALDGAPEARDFTDYPTPTVSGRIEIWLAGEPGRTATRASRPAPAKPAPAQVVEAETPDPYSPLQPRDQVREVQRILLDRLQGN